MPKAVHYSIVPLVGDIDKYVIKLTDTSGNTIGTPQTIVPPFDNPIVGDFNDVPSANLIVVSTPFIGALSKSGCSKAVSTLNPMVAVTGGISAVGKNIIISGINPTMSCDVSFFVYFTTSNGSFSTTIVVPAGATGATKTNADGMNGVVESIAPTTSGSGTFVMTTTCGYTDYTITLTIGVISNPVTFYYGETSLDTTGSTPTEAAYIASVDDVFTASDELTGTLANTGDNLRAAFLVDVGNPYTVKFIQVPASESNFTKWSEEGNSLQQNQAIDAVFGTGSNVWFKTTRAGQTLYMTRAQTSFVGDIILSR